MTASPSTSSTPLRVLAWPAFANKRGNPYTALLYEPMTALRVQVEEFTLGRLLTGTYDIIHVHWPDGLFVRRDAWKALAGGTVLLALLWLARRRGAQLVWTVHNLGAHESHHPRLEQIFWQGFVRQVDGFISLSAAGLDAIEARFPDLADRPRWIVPHGSYRERYPAPAAPAEARHRLELSDDDVVLVHVGFIRPYKNVPHLVRTFHAVTAPTMRLLIAGQPASASLRDEIAAAARGDARIRLHVGYVPDAQLADYLASADLVVLPYAEILNSGTALLALSFNRPVLVPARGAMQELQQDIGADWVRTYTGPLTPEDIQHAAAWARQTPRAAEAPLDRRAWPHLARQTVDAYRALLAS